MKKEKASMRMHALHIPMKEWKNFMCDGVVQAAKKYHAGFAAMPKSPEYCASVMFVREEDREKFAYRMTQLGISCVKDNFPAEIPLERQF